MVLSKRERIILIVTILVVGALVADKLIFGPVKGRLDELEVRRQQLLAAATRRPKAGSCGRCGSGRRPRP